MWMNALGKNRRFKKTSDSSVLEESGTGRKWYPLMQLMQAGTLKYSDLVKLQRAGETHLPLAEEMLRHEVMKLGEILNS